jgi:hypothetical protein
MRWSAWLCLILAPAFTPAQETGPEVAPIDGPYARGLPAIALPTNTPPEPVVQVLVGLGGQLSAAMALSGPAIHLPFGDRPDAGDLGDPMGMVGAAVGGLAPGTPFRVEVSAPPFLETGAFSGVFPGTGTHVRVFPALPWRRDRLLALDHPEAVVVHARLEAAGRRWTAPDAHAVIRPRTDCPVAVIAEPERGERDLDLAPLLGLYVDENHPWTEAVLREGVESGLTPAFAGYREPAPEAVFRQVYAIWDTLERRGLSYEDPPAASESGRVLWHSVPAFEEAARRRAGSSTDGVLLFAAALGRAGIKPYLIRGPGTLLLAFARDEDGHEVVGLDVTRLGEPPEKMPVIDMPAAFTDSLRTHRGFPSFTAALSEGARRLEEAMGRISDGDPAWRVVDLFEAREWGVRAFSGAAGF